MTSPEGVRDDDFGCCWRDRSGSSSAPRRGASHPALAEVLRKIRGATTSSELKTALVPQSLWTNMKTPEQLHDFITDKLTAMLHKKDSTHRDLIFDLEFDRRLCSPVPHVECTDLVHWPSQGIYKVKEILANGDTVILHKFTLVEHIMPGHGIAHSGEAHPVEVSMVSNWDEEEAGAWRKGCIPYLLFARILKGHVKAANLLEGWKVRNTGRLNSLCRMLFLT